jgi:hypothetical protein
MDNRGVVAQAGKPVLRLDLLRAEIDIMRTIIVTGRFDRF